MSAGRQTPRVWDGLAAAISADRAVVSAPACELLVQVMDAYARRETGGRYSPALEHVRNVLEMVAASGVRDTTSGQADPRNRLGSAWSTTDEIGTEEAGVLLQVSREHANRLARAGVLGPTRKIGNRRLVSRAQVVAYTAGRSTR